MRYVLRNLVIGYVTFLVVAMYVSSSSIVCLLRNLGSCVMIRVIQLTLNVL